MLLASLKRILLRLDEHLIVAKLTLYTLDVGAASVLYGIWIGSIICTSSVIFGALKALLSCIEIITLGWLGTVILGGARSILLVTPEVGEYIPILEAD